MAHYFSIIGHSRFWKLELIYCSVKMSIDMYLLSSGFVDRSPVSDTEEAQMSVPLFCSPAPQNLPVLHDPYQAYSLEKVGSCTVLTLK